MIKDALPEYNLGKRLSMSGGKLYSGIDYDLNKRQKIFSAGNDNPWTRFIIDAKKIPIDELSEIEQLTVGNYQRVLSWQLKFLSSQKEIPCDPLAYGVKTIFDEFAVEVLWGLSFAEKGILFDDDEVGKLEHIESGDIDFSVIEGWGMLVDTGLNGYVIGDKIEREAILNLKDEVVVIERLYSGLSGFDKLSLITLINTSDEYYFNLFMDDPRFAIDKKWHREFKINRMNNLTELMALHKPVLQIAQQNPTKYNYHKV